MNAHEQMRAVLERAAAKQQPRRFDGAPITSLGDLGPAGSALPRSERHHALDARQASDSVRISHRYSACRSEACRQGRKPCPMPKVCGVQMFDTRWSPVVPVLVVLAVVAIVGGLALWRAAS